MSLLRSMLLMLFSVISNVSFSLPSFAVTVSGDDMHMASRESYANLDKQRKQYPKAAVANSRSDVAGTVDLRNQLTNRLGVRSRANILAMHLLANIPRLSRNPWHFLRSSEPSVAVKSVAVKEYTDTETEEEFGLYCDVDECFIVPIPSVECDGVECVIKELEIGPSVPKVGLNTGFKIWDAGRTLSQVLISDYLQKLPAMHVLELGSGTGVGGLTAAAAGAKVLLTDGSEDILKLLQKNVHANGFDRNAEVRHLLWGEHHQEDILKDREPFDLIIGSDLLYAPEVFDSLLDSLEQLCVPGVTEVLLAFPPRYTESIFFERARDRSFEIIRDITEVETGIYTVSLQLESA